LTLRVNAGYSPRMAQNSNSAPRGPGPGPIRLRWRAIAMLAQTVELFALERGLSPDDAAGFARTYREIMALPDTSERW
jgi:hypothetical protein